MALPLLHKPTTKTNGSQFWQGGPTKTHHIFISGGREFSSRNERFGQLIQVFSEHETLNFNRQITLETRLANGSITVRDFMRELAKSQRFWNGCFG